MISTSVTIKSKDICFGALSRWAYVPVRTGYPSLTVRVVSRERPGVSGPRPRANLTEAFRSGRRQFYLAPGHPSSFSPKHAAPRTTMSAGSVRYPNSGARRLGEGPRRRSARGAPSWAALGREGEAIYTSGSNAGGDAAGSERSVGLGNTAPGTGAFQRATNAQIGHEGGRRKWREQFGSKYLDSMITNRNTWEIDLK